MPVFRMLSRALGAAALLLAAPTFATTPAPQGAAPLSDFYGVWELDLATMPVTYGAPPKRVLYSFAKREDAQTTMAIDITDRDDTVRHIGVTFRVDGRMVKGEGYTGEGDSAAFGAPIHNVLVMTTAGQGQLISVRTYAIADDGQTMTESAADVDGDGTPFVRNFHYRRIG